MTISIAVSSFIAAAAAAEENQNVIRSIFNSVWINLL